MKLKNNIKTDAVSSVNNHHHNNLTPFSETAVEWRLPATTVSPGDDWAFPRFVKRGVYN